MSKLDTLLGYGILPDFVIRAGIRRFLKQKLHLFRKDNPQQIKENFARFLEELDQLPIAINTSDANSQHYELPPQFFKSVLGKRMKYSCAFFKNKNDSDWQKALDKAEEDMLDLYLERAEIKNGQNILDLGCGWGSFTLYCAQKFPQCQLLAVSNSVSQRLFIESEVSKLGLSNVKVRTANILDLQLSQKFDRIISIEMFEHMKNYRQLFKKLSSWLIPEGKLFVHIFTHKEYAYHYDKSDENDWMTEYFFSGGTMPSDNLLLYFQEDLSIQNHWVVSGSHYQKTANAWLKKMDLHKRELFPYLEETYGKAKCKIWWNYWRVFFMACAELWGYQNGQEWQVSHYLFSLKQDRHFRSHLESV